MRVTAAERREPVESRARSDMRAYAIHNAVPIEREESFVVQGDWRPEWALYQVDVFAGREVVRVYEAVSRFNPELRYTAMWYQDAGHATKWERVID